MKKLFDHIYSKIKDLNFEENELCRQYWLKLERLKDKFTDEAGIALLFDNIEWLIISEVVTGKDIEKLGDSEKLFDAGIYFGGCYEIKDDQAILFGDATAEVSGHSRIRCFDKSQVEAYDSTFITAFHKSKVSAKNCKIVAFHDAEITSKGFCLIEKYDDSVKVEGTNKDLVY